MQHDPPAALEVLQGIRLVRVNMDRIAEGQPTIATLGESDPPDGIDARKFTALVRLAYGEMCEASARTRALRNVQRYHVAHDLEDPCSYARLLFDSYVASVWSTAHAEYLCTIEELLERMPIHTATEDVQPPTPSPAMVSFCPSGMPDLAHLVDRRSSSMLTAKMMTSKAALAMSNLFNRCTGTSSKGWDSAVMETGKEMEPCSKVCFSATIAALCGLNPIVHPADRPTWEERLEIHRIIVSHASEPKKLLSLCGCASREAVRIYMAMTLGNTPCVREALLTAGHPAGSLVVSPFELSPASLQSVSTTLASIGQVVRATRNLDCILKLNDECFSDEAKRTKRSAQPTTSSRALVAVRKAGLIVPSLSGPTWRIRATPASCMPPTLMSAVTDLSSACFGADMRCLWSECWHKKMRISRLSEAQHRVLHEKSPIRDLLASIPDTRRLFVQRAALTEPRAFFLTVNEVATQLGLSLTDSNEKAPDLLACSAAAAADLMLYARVAAMKFGLLSFSLGEKTRRMQIRALSKRLLVDVAEGDTPDDVLNKVPLTARNLCLCVECKRVANATQQFQGKDVPFNECGISSAMLRVDGTLQNGTMRCAKRSSATLRASVQLEIDSALREQSHASVDMSVDKQSISARMKRDRKACFDQPGVTMPCGDQDMVLVPIVGRAVKVFGSFYALCTFCGALTHLLYNNRFEGEICCMRCDYRMLTKGRPDLVHEEEQEPPHHFCRFCGKRDSAPKATSKWKTTFAPQDDTGINATIPPPLRTVVYCTSHTKQWLAAAHRSSMTMAEVFAHLSMKIKPVFAYDDVCRPALDFKNIMPVARNPGGIKLKRQRRVLRKMKKQS